MTDSELLDKVCNFTDRNAKTLVAEIGGYILSVVVIAWKLSDWIVANAQENPYALVAFGIGGVATGAFLASLFWRRVVKNAFKANAEHSELVRDDETADAIKRYNSLRDRGNDVRLVVSERMTVRTGGDYYAVENARLKAQVDELERKLDEMRERIGDS